MNQSYEQFREDFDPIYYLIGLAIFILLFCFINKDKKVEKKAEDDPRKRLFTKEELR